MAIDSERSTTVWKWRFPGTGMERTPHAQDERADVHEEILQRPQEHGVHRGRPDQQHEQGGQHAQVAWSCCVPYRDPAGWGTS
jgi:hypothetical protein